MLRLWTTGFLMIVCWSLWSCKKELSAEGSPTTVTLQFTNKVGLAPLTLGTVYTNATTGEQFDVTTLKYYISNVQLISKNGTFTNAPSVYHLVDASDTTTASLSFTASPDSLIALSFLVGVDSTHCANGPRTGDLDPAKGMFWNAAQGYIMAELEGISPASTQPGYAYTYQIGGYTGPNNVLRKVTLALPGLPVTARSLFADTILISIDADVDAWFSGPHYLPISSNATCTTPGALASEYADNYARMFVARNVQVK
ncbi:MbnP family protein [Dinghuibacter silviterrae]|uniref:Copper-binding protein MbnP-like domain-containing protein n=1 Tax=Dinghuibacter silviterrae TaxID=1539049 RepID=A0A4R8DQ63_9BACT|nr:MbnP family protein [Dinghuibacter silviterrae]TDW99436.1 hypothetical protein EDB95_0446 [Dinghuibacter silviterrae]